MEPLSENAQKIVDNFAEMFGKSLNHIERCYVNFCETSGAKSVPLLLIKEIHRHTLESVLRGLNGEIPQDDQSLNTNENGKKTTSGESGAENAADQHAS